MKIKLTVLLIFIFKTDNIIYKSLVFFYIIKCQITIFFHNFIFLNYFIKLNFKILNFNQFFFLHQKL